MHIQHDIIEHEKDVWLMSFSSLLISHSKTNSISMLLWLYKIYANTIIILL